MDAKNAIVWQDGQWQSAEKGIVSATSLGFWLSSTIFDGARSFETVAPDLDLHCQRAIRSAVSMGMDPTVTEAATWQDIYRIAWGGIEQYAPEKVLYIKPLFWADEGFIAPDPQTTKFALVVYDAPFPEAEGFSAMLSSFRRPFEEVAPTNAKAACLYPNAGRALSEAKGKGFENAVMCDVMGNVAEFASANIFHVKDGVVYTPAPNGSFLNGITRQRVMKLLTSAGIEVREERVTPEMLLEADEIFSTGNYSKVFPVLNYEGRTLPTGPIYQKARELYFDYSRKHGQKRSF